MSLIQLKIKGISYSQSQSGAYALVLNETVGKRTLPIVIGAPEAQSIAIALEQYLKPDRPLTHDLIVSLSETYRFTIKEVIIHKLIDGIFYSSLICEKNKVEEIIDSRTSDAIALALRFKAPIYTYDNILEKAGFVIDDNDNSINDNELDEEDRAFVDQLFDELEQNTEGFIRFSLEELYKQLDAAINNEDYELAARIRDEIDKRELEE